MSLYNKKTYLLWKRPRWWQSEYFHLWLVTSSRCLTDQWRTFNFFDLYD